MPTSVRAIFASWTLDLQRPRRVGKLKTILYHRSSGAYFNEQFLAQVQKCDSLQQARQTNVLIAADEGQKL